ncbi:MAG: NAD-dependent epimerase/dehydratase family protein [Rhodoglobus sp.]
MKPSVLVTGASGFVGRAVAGRLKSDGIEVRLAVRSGTGGLPAGSLVFEIGDMDASTDWRAAVSGATAVVHCAARVHQIRDEASDSLAEFRRVNRDGTAALAAQAASAGVDRFVFISSIKVHGESTAPHHPFRAAVPPVPLGPYGISKWEAELALRRIESETELRVVALRPPLVYGPGVKANFRNMMHAIWRGWPLPLGAVHNRRSLVALDNLVDLIALALRHEAAPGRAFLVSDDEDLSTTDLLRRVGSSLGRPARLLPVPSSWLRTAAAMVGRPGTGHRLCDSLQVDIDETRTLLGWRPVIQVDEALVKTAQHFLAEMARPVSRQGDNRGR